MLLINEEGIILEIHIIMYPSVHGSTIYNSQDMQATLMCIKIKDKYYIIFTFIWNIKNNTKILFTHRNRLTDIENKPLVIKGRVGRIIRSKELTNTHYYI